jgi:hypothetical protein
VEEILDPQDIWGDFPEIAIYYKKLTSFADLNVRYLKYSIQMARF